MFCPVYQKKGLSPITPSTSYAINYSHVKFLSIAAVSAGTFERDAVKVDLTSQEFRSLAVSSDGKHLAAGDCNGNLHIYNLQTSDYTCLQVNSDT
jgi:WD40 repeat protein